MHTRKSSLPNSSSPVNFYEPLPQEVDVVVIGAGVIGVASAWFLQKNGLRVAVLDKGRVAGEQSSRNWGWIRQHGRDSAELPIVMESLRHWQEISSQLDRDIGFRRRGVLYLARNEQELAARARWLNIAQEHDLDSRLLNRAALDRLLDLDTHEFIGGAYTASDARAEPFLAVPSIARALACKGVTISERCVVSEIEREAGRVSGVVTERGSIRCRAVLCAAGVWSSRMLREIGADFPQLAVRATVARTARAPLIFNGAMASATLAMRRRIDGGYTLAPGGYFDHFLSADSLRYLRQFAPMMWRSRGDFSVAKGAAEFLSAPLDWSEQTPSADAALRVLNPPPNRSALSEISNQLAAQFPLLRNVPIVEAWAGMIDATPDVVPVMDQVTAVPGCFVASGFSGHGFGIGFGAGRVMADLIGGNRVGHDLRRFQLARFSDGRRLELGPAL